MRPMILLFTSRDCPVCLAALPEWERFKTKNPMAMAVAFDADGPWPLHFGIRKIRATPLYVLKNGDEGVTHEGLMKAEALEKWMRAAVGVTSP